MRYFTGDMAGCQSSRRKEFKAVYYPNKEIPFNGKAFVRWCDYFRLDSYDIIRVVWNLLGEFGCQFYRYPYQYYNIGNNCQGMPVINPDIWEGIKKYYNNPIFIKEDKRSEEFLQAILFCLYSQGAIE